jgi:hypothetical protein
MAFPDTTIMFTLYAGTRQTNGTCGALYELLSAPSNTSFFTFMQDRPCNQFCRVFWNTPSRTAIGTTSVFVVRATDQGTPPLSSTTTVSIAIIDVPPLHTISLSNSAPVLQFTNPFTIFTNPTTGNSHQRYLVESSTNLAATNWSQRQIIYSSSPWVTFTDTNPPTPQCFYRLRPYSGWDWWYPAINTRLSVLTWFVVFVSVGA